MQGFKVGEEKFGDFAGGNSFASGSGRINVVGPKNTWRKYNGKIGKGHAVGVTTETTVFDSDLKRLDDFESMGSSDAEKVFSKKGGPQVNLNAALENNIKAVVEYLQDSIRSGKWKQPGTV